MLAIEMQQLVLSLQQKREDRGIKEQGSCGWFFGLGVHDAFAGSYMWYTQVVTVSTRACIAGEFASSMSGLPKLLELFT